VRGRHAVAFGRVNLALQVLLSGLAAGAVYGLVAVGHALVYRLTGIVHLAFGDVIGLGVFVALAVLGGTGSVTPSVAPGRLALALAVGLGACAGASVLTYWLAVDVRPGGGSPVGWAGATLAVAFALHSVVGAFLERASYVFPDPLPFGRLGHDGFLDVAGAQLEARALFIASVGLLLATLGALLLTRTRSGQALRASAEDPEAAGAIGLPVRRLTILTFAASGAIAGVAAIAAAPAAPLDVNSATLLGVKGLAAALIVGFGEPWRAFAAGLLFGVVESAVASLRIAGYGMGPAYSVALPLAAAIAVAAVRAWRLPGWEAAV
jgi:branched-chain amino acid transport system permease protein